jgi:hypothetical protein
MTSKGIAGEKIRAGKAVYTDDKGFLRQTNRIKLERVKTALLEFQTHLHLREVGQ